MKRIALVVVSLVTISLVVGGLWYWRSQTPAPTFTGSNANTPAERPAPPVGEYETRAGAAVAPLRVALEANDQAALDAAVPVAKASLMELVVPSDARGEHLALILALAKYEQAKEEGGDPSAARVDIKQALRAFPDSP